MTKGQSGIFKRPNDFSSNKIVRNEVQMALL